VNLLVTFLVAIVIALVGLAWVGVIIDKMTSPFVSLLVFFPMLFLTIWLTWRLSVKLTEPKGETRA
jgi:hypothetical protein